MKKSNPKSLDTLLTSALEELGIAKKIKQQEAVLRWSEVVGEQIARAATPIKMDGSTLIVKVEKSTWRNELVMLKREIISKLNAALQQDIVKDIVFK